LSPFSPASGAWNTGPKADFSSKPTASMGAIAEMPRPSHSPDLAPETHQPRSATPFPAVASAASGFAETFTEGSLAKAPHAESALTADALREAVVSALAAAGHASASQLLGAGTWAIEGGGLRIEVAAMGKKMLSLTVNAAAERIIRQELQRLGAPARFLIVPGAATGEATAAVTVPVSGSVQEAALAHPLVQRAKEIFKAEVRSVVDLRIK
jgi:DNA polymerase-3 subunit gamma/tau